MFFWKNSNLKAVISMIVIFCIAISNIGCFVLEAQTAGKVLTINQAVQYAQSTSKNYRKKKNTRVTKRIQLTQAIDAVKDARKKQTTVRFSLLFNIKWPEKYALPKEIDLLMKIPKVETEIRDLTRELQDILLAEKEKAENCFIDLYGYIEKYRFGQGILDEMNSKYEKMQVQQKVGDVNKNDVLSLEKRIKAQETKVAGLLQKVEQYKGKMSDIVGFDVSNGYIFANPMQKTDISREYLTNILNYTIQNDFNLYKTKSAENMARRNVDELYNVYGNRWGGLIKRIESDVKMNKPIDYDQFLNKYNILLEDIDKPWVGNYVIWLLFFKIKIPKIWFKKELDGIRYFEDQKYAIFVALMEKEDAINETENMKKELTSGVKDGYESMKELWKTYETSSLLLEKSKKEYDRVFSLNKMGDASYDEVDVEKSNLESAQETELDSLIAYNKQVVAFDRLTCGAISSLKKNVSLFLKSVQTGNSVLEETLNELQDLMGDNDNANGNKILYNITNAVDKYRAVFKLQVPESYPKAITHFEIITPEGVVISNRSPITKSVSALPVEYRGSTELIVRFYNNDNFVTEGSFDAINVSGYIDLKTTNTETQVKDDEVLNSEDAEKSLQQNYKVFGNFFIEKVAITSIERLKVSIHDSEGISYYRIVDSNGNQLGKRNKYYSLNQSFSYLGFAMKDINTLKIQLFDSAKKLKATASFDIDKNEIVVVE